MKKISFFEGLKNKYSLCKNNIALWWNTKHPLPYEELDTLPTEEKKEKNLSTGKQAVIFWGVGLLFVALWAIFYHTMSYVFMFIAAFIASLAMESIIGFWSRLTHKRGLGILIAYTLALFFLLSGFIILIPIFSSLFGEIFASLKDTFQTLQGEITEKGFGNYLNEIPWISELFGDEIAAYIDSFNAIDIMPTLTDNLGKIMNLFSSYTKEYAVIFFSMIGNLIIFFTLSIFFSISHFRIKQVLKYCFRDFAQAKDKIDNIYTSVAHWLKSQLFLCFFIGITTYIGLHILSLIGYDIPNKGVFAILSGLFEIIPYIGPYFWALPVAVLWAIWGWFPWFLAVIILYVVIQQTEENVLVPYLMSKTLGVSPLLIFICMLLASSLMGIFGIVFAVPLAVIIATVFSFPEPVKTLEKKKSLKEKIQEKFQS